MASNRTTQIQQVLVALTFATLAAIVFNGGVTCQDYEGDGETSLSGLAGLGLGSGSITGYAPMSASDAGLASAGSSSGSVSTNGADSDNSDVGDYEDDSDSAAASEMHPILSRVISLISGARHKRSIDESTSPEASSGQESKVRVKRGYKGWVPYVSTYVKTDKKANFKWGVKAKVGKKYGR
ncbi:hypothetical protein GZH46_01836, partial [Fragariocoptes setiger]